MAVPPVAVAPEGDSAVRPEPVWRGQHPDLAPIDAGNRALQAAIRVPNLSRLDRGEEGKLGAINSLGQTW